MSKTALQAVAAVLASVAVSAFVAWAGGQAGATVAGRPVVWLCALLAFVINWAAFVPAYLLRTEHYYDLAGSVTYLALVACALLFGGRAGPLAVLLGGLVAVWALRLGAFLFARVRRVGADERFDEIKNDAGRFLAAWTLQALWVFLTLCCALSAMTATENIPLGGWAVAGTAVWLGGFAIEVIADRQKARFRANPDRRGLFITSGLWAWSRHPNYFGEITLWVGIALIALPTLAGWRYVTLVSPVFVYLLITYVSGVPLLEQRAEAKWGDDADYRAYVARTPVLFPRPPRGP
jgi:steroid 5-alpha reductase family enzyme